MVSKESPGEIKATLMARGHTARIAITYNLQDVTIKYDSSENLHYGPGKDGEPVIHKNYNSWIRNLAQDINRYILLAGD
jgi:hypothetical protein